MSDLPSAPLNEKHKQTYDDPEDMDLCSDDEELILSPGLSSRQKLQDPRLGFPRNSDEHKVPSQIQPPQPDPDIDRFRSFLSMEVGTPPDRQNESDVKYARHQPSPPMDFELTRAYLHDMRQIPADDPAVYSKIFQSGKYTLVGSEIGGDKWQEQSLDGSDLTQSTTTVTSKRPRLMPSFEPKERPNSGVHLGSEKNLMDTSDLSGETLEEYSIPDEEVNRETEIIVDGKRYLHRKLDPGWVVKVSTTHHKPYYVHPDFGTTWLCPNSLPPKSKARKFHRSKRNVPSNRDGILPAIPDSRNPTFSPRPSHQVYEDLGTMSDLIKGWKKQQRSPNLDSHDGYEASVSCNSSLSRAGSGASDAEFSNQASSEVSHEEQSKSAFGTATQRYSKGTETCEWITPMRLGIATPQNVNRRHSSGTQRNKPTTPALSPIDEDDNLLPSSNQESTNKDISAFRDRTHDSAPELPTLIAKSESKRTPADNETVSDRSTPRVSFEPTEVGCVPPSDSVTGLTSNVRASLESPVQESINSMPDTEQSRVLVDEPQQFQREVVVGSSHQSSRRKDQMQRIATLNTPEEVGPKGSSEARAPSKKRQSLFLTSHNANGITEDQIDEATWNVRTVSEPPVYQSTPSISDAEKPPLRVDDEPQQLPREVDVGSSDQSSRRNNEMQRAATLNTPREVGPRGPSEARDAPKKRQSLSRTSHDANGITEDQIDEASWNVHTVSEPPVYQSTTSISEDEQSHLRVDEPQQLQREVVLASSRQSSRRNNQMQGAATLNTPQEVDSKGPSEARDAPKKRQSLSRTPYGANSTPKDKSDETPTSMVSGKESRLKEVHHLVPTGDGESSPQRNEALTFVEKREESPGIPSSASKGLAITDASLALEGFGITDDCDFSSPSISQNEVSSCYTTHRSNLRRVTSPPTTVKNSVSNLVQSPLSVTPTRNSSKTFVPRRIDLSDKNDAILSPPRLRHSIRPHLLGIPTPPGSESCGLSEPSEPYDSTDTGRQNHFHSAPNLAVKRFNWRVTHPLYPICSLQRIDELLKEQRKRQRNVLHHRRPKNPRKQTVQPLKAKHQGRKHRSQKS